MRGAASSHHLRCAKRECYCPNRELFSACIPIPKPHHEFGTPLSASRREPTPMSPLSRRDFLATSAAVISGGLTPLGSPAFAAVDPPKFKLGLVTYYVAKDWDLPTILK